jgi:hypothetical protein
MKKISADSGGSTSGVHLVVVALTTAGHSLEEEEKKKHER